jgi:hypothetical protein
MVGGEAKRINERESVQPFVLLHLGQIPSDELRDAGRIVETVSEVRDSLDVRKLGGRPTPGDACLQDGNCSCEFLRTFLTVGADEAIVLSRQRFISTHVSSCPRRIRGLPRVMRGVKTIAIGDQANTPRTRAPQSR